MPCACSVLPGDTRALGRHRGDLAEPWVCWGALASSSSRVKQEQGEKQHPGFHCEQGVLFLLLFSGEGQERMLKLSSAPGTAISVSTPALAALPYLLSSVRAPTHTSLLLCVDVPCVCPSALGTCPGCSHSLCPWPGPGRGSEQPQAPQPCSTHLKTNPTGSFVFQWSAAGIRTLFPWVWKCLYILNVSLLQRKRACAINSCTYATRACLKLCVYMCKAINSHSSEVRE